MSLDELGKAAGGKGDSTQQRRREIPHLWNLNEDPALTNVIVHFLDKGETRVGQ